MTQSRKPWPRLFKLLRRIAFIYVMVILGLIILEPRLVYVPFDGPSEPTEAGLKNFSRHTLAAEGLPTITYWESTSKPGAPTVLYFHGNAGGLHYHTKPLVLLAKHGFHVIAMEYPGYPGAEGKPEEGLIIRQTQTLYDATRKQTGKPPSIWGFSLGSGVATQLAASRETRALILEAPFTAAVDRAAELYPLIPVRYIMHNTYRSRDYIGAVKAPILILHGDADTVVPFHQGSALFALAHEPKTFKKYPGFGHLNLSDAGAYDDILAFLRTH